MGKKVKIEHDIYRQVLPIFKWKSANPVKMRKIP